MDEMLPDEIRVIRDSVNRFMETEVNPVMDGFEGRGEFPRDLVKNAGDAGFYGCVFPESVGGTDLGYLAATVVSEELARNDCGSLPATTNRDRPVRNASMREAQWSRS